MYKNRICSTFWCCCSSQTCSVYSCSQHKDFEFEIWDVYVSADCFFPPYILLVFIFDFPLVRNVKKKLSKSRHKQVANTKYYFFTSCFFLSLNEKRKCATERENVDRNTSKSTRMFWIWGELNCRLYRYPIAGSYKNIDIVIETSKYLSYCYYQKFKPQLRSYAQCSNATKQSISITILHVKNKINKSTNTDNLYIYRWQLRPSMKLQKVELNNETTTSRLQFKCEPVNIERFFVLFFLVYVDLILMCEY